MRNSIFSFFLLLTLLFFTTCKSPVEVELYGDLSGTITDATTKEPVVGAIVTLSPSSSSTRTGSDGKYSFTELDPQDYKIDVSCEGYTTNSKTLTIKAGETTIGDISISSLQPIIDASLTSLDFGETLTQLPLVISNIGKGELSWSVTEDVGWLSVNPISGKTTTQKSSIVVTVDRTNVSQGTYSQSVSVISNGGVKTITISMIVANPYTPKVTTGTALNVSQYTADITGNVTSLGSGAVTEYGHCYDTKPNPTVFFGLKTSLGQMTTPGAFTSSFSGLQKNTTYYVRAYATNSNGTGYSTETTFTTSDSPTLPNLTIQAASGITQNTATVGGGVASVGTTNITQYGHCWSTNTNPTTENSKTTLGAKSAIGNYNSNITNLLPGTTYYVKAYATNTAGTAYSTEISFTTLQAPTPPTVVTGTASNLSLTGATVSGNITSIGTSSIIQYGHCWSTSQEPTTSNAKTALGSKSNTGSYNSILTGLLPNTSYYVRAYATNSEGTTYGAQVQLKTESPMPPTVSTGVVSGITMSGALVGGTVTDLGTSSITQHGHCWSLTQTPTISNFKSQLGGKTTIGDYSSTLTNLEAGKTYFVRAYATNSDGTSYGDQVQFNTVAPALATLTTSSVTNLTYNSATLNGNITDIGGTGETITEYGFCYATTSSPTVANTKLIAGNNKTTIGSFTANASGLSQNTTYYVRTYAINSAGTAYGNEQIFKTAADPYTVSDGLLAFYNFDSQNAKDALGSFNGVVSGGVTYTAATNNASGYAAEFNGSNGFINIPYQIFPSTGSWTYSSWVKTNRDYFGILYIANVWNIYVQSSMLYVSAGWSYYFSFTNNLSNSILDNNWHQLTIVYNGSAGKYYIDGELNENKTGSFAWGTNDNTKIGVYYSSSDRYFFGSMDNIRFYNRALTTTEITTLYNAKQ